MYFANIFIWTIDLSRDLKFLRSVIQYNAYNYIQIIFFEIEKRVLHRIMYIFCNWSFYKLYTVMLCFFNEYQPRMYFAIRVEQNFGYFLHCFDEKFDFFSWVKKVKQYANQLSKFFYMYSSVSNNRGVFNKRLGPMIFWRSKTFIRDTILKNLKKCT